MEGGCVKNLLKAYRYFFIEPEPWLGKKTDRLHNTAYAKKQHDEIKLVILCHVYYVCYAAMYHCYSLIMNGRPCFLLSNIYIIYRYRYITCRKQPYICYLTWRFRDRFNRRNEQQVDLHHLSGGLHRPRAASHSFQRSVLRPLDRIIFDLDRIRHVVQKPCFWFTLTLL